MKQLRHLMATTLFLISSMRCSSRHCIGGGGSTRSALRAGFVAPLFSVPLTGESRRGFRSTVVRHGRGRRRRGKGGGSGGEGDDGAPRKPRPPRVEAAASTEGVPSAWDAPSTLAVPDGVLAVYKPQGWSSADVVGRVRWILQTTLRDRLGEKRKVKVGHGGTLDPLATGVLVLGIGKGCRDLESYLRGFKRYRALGLLGSETTTLDSEGEPVEGELGSAEWSHVGHDSHLSAALPSFVGDPIWQVPPMFSALSRNGTRLYDCRMYLGGGGRLICCGGQGLVSCRW